MSVPGDSSPASPKPAATVRRPWPLRFLRGVLWTLIFLVTLLVLAWCFGAVWINGPCATDDANFILACVWAVVALAAPLLARPVWARWMIRLACVLAVIIPWSMIPASNDRIWMPEYAHAPKITIEGDVATIENVRNFDYQPGGIVIERWETRKVHLSNLRGTDMALNYWGSAFQAHPIFSFDFGPDGRIAFSIETRREKGEESTIISTLYKRFELIYLACDERDVLRLRTNYRSDNDSFLYKLHYRPEVMRDRFLEYAGTVNRLHDHPRYYNVLTANCTTSVRAQVNPVDRLPFDWRMVANGYMDEMLHDHGIIITRLPFAEFKKRSNIMDAGKAADRDPQYSQRIREGLEGFEAVRPPAKVP